MASIVAVGRASFGGGSSAVVTFAKPIHSDYYVLVTGDGSNGGAMAKAHDVFTVSKRIPQGFTIETSNSMCKQTVDYLVVT